MRGARAGPEDPLLLPEGLFWAPGGCYIPRGQQVLPPWSPVDKQLFLGSCTHCFLPQCVPTALHVPGRGCGETKPCPHCHWGGKEARQLKNTTPESDASSTGSQPGASDEGGVPRGRRGPLERWRMHYIQQGQDWPWPWHTYGKSFPAGERVQRPWGMTSLREQGQIPRIDDAKPTNTMLSLSPWFVNGTKGH